MDEQQSGNNTRRVGARTKNTILPLAADMGRIPPHATDLEQAVLGAMMLEKNAVTIPSICCRRKVSMIRNTNTSTEQFVNFSEHPIRLTCSPEPINSNTKANWKWPA